MLQVRNLNVKYGNVQVLWDVSCEVNEGEFVSVIGPNASGKTTLLKSIVRLVKPEKGDVIFDGREIRSPEEAVKRGLYYVTGKVFPGMTVLENLYIRGHLLPKSERRKRLKEAFEIFPFCMSVETSLQIP
jgi:branched-chain amino acid transport system ATP-binding protein